MPHAHTMAGVSSALILMAAGAIIASGCQPSADVAPTGTASGPTSKQLSIAAVSQTAFTASDCVAPGTSVTPGPAVRVTDASGQVQPGILVSFAVSKGTGSVEHSTAMTDAAGIASAGAWRLGNNNESENAVTASLASGASVTFSAIAVRPDTVRAVFDLTAVGGQPLPGAYAGLATGGHYYLGTSTYELRYENGSTDAAPTTLCTNAAYTTTQTGFQFFLAPGSYPSSLFYQQLGGLFATATVTNGRTMLVHYEDAVDFEDETYTLAAGMVPSLVLRPGSDRTSRNKPTRNP